jgi:hypothetical protein
MKRPSSLPLSRPTSSVEELSLQFTDLLCGLAEDAATKRGNEIIAAIFSSVSDGTIFPGGKGAARRAAAERRRLVAMFTRQIVGAIEQSMHARVRELLDHGLASSGRVRQATQAVDPFPQGPDLAAVELPRRRQIRRRRPILLQPPPLDPEQIKRDAEFARLRALLKPMAEEMEPRASAPVASTPAPQSQRPQTPAEFLRALEQEIMNAVPFLGDLGPERCGAQIAVWAGLARELRDRLSPELAATMRPAFRIFFEHLTQLRDQMDTQIVDALDPTWTPPDWSSYVEVNRARVEGRAPDISTDRLHVHHRTMLRALTLQHRRRAPEEVSPIITAAAAVLPASDPQLQSTVRRFGSTWKAPAAPAAAPPPSDEKAPGGAPLSAEPENQNDAKEPDSDFAQPWTK